MTTDNNAVALRRPTGALAVTDGQVEWTDMQRAALAQIGIEAASTADQQVFLHYCQRTGLDPFARQVYMIARKDDQGRPRWTIQTGIDGFRVTARRSARRAGETLSYEDPKWCGPDGVWRDVWVSAEPPAAARMCVIKTTLAGQTERFPAVARYGAYVARKTGGQPNRRWTDAPDQMLSKCAEALALRMAFPHDLSGVYTDDEMDQATNQVDQRTGEIRQEQPTPQRRRQWLKQFETDLDSAGDDVDELRRLWKVLASAETREFVTAEDAAVCRNRILSTTTAAATSPPADDVADAEVVPPAADPPPWAQTDATRAVILMDQTQRARLHALLGRHGVTNRDDKIQLCRIITGRVDIDSSAVLTVDEAARVIDALADIDEPFDDWFARLLTAVEPAQAPA